MMSHNMREGTMPFYTLKLFRDYRSAIISILSYWVEWWKYVSIRTTETSKQVASKLIDDIFKVMGHWLVPSKGCSDFDLWVN